MRGAKSTTGRIEATARWVSGSETSAARAGCGATMAWGSDAVDDATPEVNPVFSLPAEDTMGMGWMVVSSTGPGWVKLPTHSSVTKPKAEPSGVETSEGAGATAVSRGWTGKVPTSATEVWGDGAGCSSNSGVEQPEGRGEEGRRMVGMPETSGSSTGKRAVKSMGVGSGAGVQAGATGTTLDTRSLSNSGYKGPLRKASGTG